MRKCLKRVINNVKWIYSNKDRNSIAYYIEQEKKMFEIYSILCKTNMLRDIIKKHLTENEYEEYLEIEKHFF